MTAEVGEELTAGTEFLAMQGIANLCYRTVGSNVDKALGVKSRKNGGDGRTALNFSDADGETINKAVSAKLTELEAKEGGAAMRALKLSFAVTGQHVFGESAQGEPTKADKELWTNIQSFDGVKFEAAVKLIGIPEDYDDDSALKAVRAWRLAEDRKALEESAKKRAAMLG